MVELQPTADGVRITLTFDAMHNDEWTERAVMGWKMQLGTQGPEFGPKWYPILLVITALPCVWAGGMLVSARGKTGVTP